MSPYLMEERDNLLALKRWANPLQDLQIDAILEHGGIRAAAKALGKSKSTLQDSLRSVKTTAAAHGYAPQYGMNSPVPDPFIVKGQSTLSRIDPATGARTAVLEWNKTRIDDVKWIENVKEGINAFIESVPTVKSLPKQAKGEIDHDIIPWIQIGDAHLGMLAHEAETGANFDLKIAERELMTAIGMLIDEAPLCERMVINDLGDFTHYENMAGVTDASGHMLDYDGRFPKMIKVYSRLMRWIVEKALTKATHVDVIVNQGNHSRTNDMWMAELLRVAYGKTGRVHVLNNDTPFIGYKMGRTFVMTHHSDTAKPNRLAQVMSTDFREDWGTSEYCYVDIGHIHHNMVLKEHPGVVIESFNILAPKDKWANDGGYRARQSITMIFRSRQYGEIGRRLLPIRQVQERIREAMPELDHYIAPPRRAFTV
jgi:hypothetical protein